MAGGIYVQRRNWTPAEKRAIALEAFSESGTDRRSVSKVARRHGVRNYQLYRWRDKYLSGSDAPSLVPVRLTADVSVERSISPAVATAPTATVATCAEIIRGDGQIRVPVSAGVDFITSLYVALNRAAP
jgi:transposase-like protein